MTRVYLSLGAVAVIAWLIFKRKDTGSVTEDELVKAYYELYY